MNQNNRVYRFRLVVIATAFISGSVLSFEIILTRIFSVMLSYHFVFAVISFSLLGMGLGGMMLRVWQKKMPGFGLGSTAVTFAFLISLSAFLIIKLPIYESTGWASFRVWIYILIATLPFFFAGLTLSAIFQQYPVKSSILYGFDLLGATMGVLASVYFLNIFGGVKAVYVTALIAVTGAILISMTESLWSFARKLIVAAILLVIFLLPEDFSTQVPIATDFNKDMYRMLKNPKEQAKIVESRWSAFGRTDLLRSPVSPNEMVLFVDGAAGTVMYNLDSLLSNERSQAYLVNHFGLFFPFYFLKENEKNNALIIGPGGGRDVVVSLLGGVKDITAVEVNPDLVALVKKYEKFNGGIYTSNPNVRVVIQEGRNYLRTTHNQYDLIMLSIPITKSSRSREGFALTENFLFTVEAFEDFLNHLTPEGRIVIVAHNEAEIYRLIGLALTAFEKQNISQAEAMKHLYTISSGMMPTVVIKKEPFDSLASKIRHQISHKLRFDQGNFYIPFVKQMTLTSSEKLQIDFEWRMFDQILVDIANGKLTLQQLLSGIPINIEPTTDDSPFFYNFEPGLPEPFGLFSIFIIVIFVLMTIPLFVKNQPNGGQKIILKHFCQFPQLKSFLWLFFLLGAGFMLLEIALFQKLTLYLGQPVLTLTVLLFSLLLGTGIGSFISSLIKKRLNVFIFIAAIVVSILTIIFLFVFDQLFSGLSYSPKTLTIMILIPLGFVLGFPFPLSIRLMKDYFVQEYIGWMWGVNGLASVVGSALTMIIGILFGFSYALLLGVICYLAIACLAIYLGKLKININYSV